MTAQTEFNRFSGFFLYIPFRLRVPKVLKENLEEAKHYIETGKPHPRKVAAIQKVNTAVSQPKTT